jgi:FkbM family methyltransferase
MNWNLIKFDLSKINYPIILYGLPKGIVEQFILRQYAHQTAEVSVKPEYGDIILDCGACFGDTALFMAHESGPMGKVYSFEFIKGNIQIYKRNISLNPEMERRILLIEQPVWETTGCCLYYNDNGPASKVGFEKFEGAEDQTMTISIDEMVIRHALEKVDFIKMDIEGAELSALKGAIRTLKKYKPKLAISIYHNLDHFKSIPEFIKTISPEYRLYLGHYTNYTEETILYAICNPNVA